MVIAMAALLLGGCAPSDAPAADQSLVEQSQGRWLVINYWAEWCKPCRHEIPELNLLDERDDVQVVGINFDGIAGDALKDLSARMGIQFRVVETDPASELGVSQPDVLPTTLIVSPDGELVAQLVGPQTAESIGQRFSVAASTGS